MDRPLDLSSRYGRGDGINANKDRQSIYGHTEPTYDVRGKISDRSFVRDSGFSDEEAIYHGKRTYRKWCAESVTTWEVVTCEGASKLCEAINVHEDSAAKSWKKKRIVCGYFFYPSGSRPTEDEIDAMLDRQEAVRIERQKRMSRLKRGRN